MKRWMGWGLIAVGLIAAGIWAWDVCFPSPERVIRQRFDELARVASFAANEGALAKVANPQKLASYFAQEVELAVEIPQRAVHRVSGRDDLVQAAMAARSTLTSLKIQFFDINVTLAPDRESATAHLTLKGQVSGERDPIVQELKFGLRKVEGTWLVHRVETVKTLS